MLFSRVIALLSLSAAVLAMLATDKSLQLKRNALVDCPEGVCLDDSTYCDMETHNCMKKGGPGPCGSGECIENKDGPAKRQLPNGDCVLDTDCKPGVESCMWIRAEGENRCVPKLAKVSTKSKTKGGRRGKRMEETTAGCGGRSASCSKDSDCCSKRCVFRHRFEVGLMNIAWCD